MVYFGGPVQFSHSRCLTVDARQGAHLTCDPMTTKEAD